MQGAVITDVSQIEYPFKQTWTLGFKVCTGSRRFYQQSKE